MLTISVIVKYLRRLAGSLVTREPGAANQTSRAAIYLSDSDYDHHSIRDQGHPCCHPLPTTGPHCGKVQGQRPAIRLSHELRDGSVTVSRLVTARHTDTDVT